MTLYFVFCEDEGMMFAVARHEFSSWVGEKQILENINSLADIPWENCGLPVDVLEALK